MNNLKLEINKELVLSSSHITESEMIQAEDSNYSNDNHNVRLHVTSMIEDLQDQDSACYNLCNNLLQLLKIAAVNGCKWLVLDSDGETYPTLQTFEW